MAPAVRKVDHSREALRYAERVVSGKIPACEWVRRAGERHLRDLDTAEARGLRFDREKANRICRFAELMPHIKGEWAKGHQRIVLQPWQKFAYCNLFGWQRHRDLVLSGLTGLTKVAPASDREWFRRFRTGYLEVPRKNSKSTMGAITGLYMLGPDEEEGAECVSAATTRKQAGAVWEVARFMTLRTPRFRDRYGIDVYRHSLVREATASNFVALSKESETLDGLNLHFGDVDELHAHKDRSLWDVLDTAMGSRAEPLLLAITTAGGNQEGICYEQRSYLIKILQGLLEDDSFWGIIYTVDDPEAWDDPKQWQIANPNYGISVDPVKLADAAKKARFSAAAQNNFKTKHLNVWVSAASAWANMEEWKAGTRPDLHEFAARELATAKGRNTFGIPPEFDGRECWISGDLASKIDIASLAFIFPDPDGGITVFGRHYLPEDLVEELAGKTGGHYAQWADRGWLTLTSGNTADFDRIEAEIEAAAGRFKLLGYCYDPWQSHQMVGHLTDKGLPCAEIKPTVANYSPAMKELEALVKGRRVRHDGNPCGLWMVSNVVVKEDYKGNIYPRKERNTAKIDWLVALLGGMNRVIVTPKPNPVCECAEPDLDEAGLCLKCQRWTATRSMVLVM